jgi:hypothetical protein
MNSISKEGNTDMNPFTIFAYIMPDGAHYVETVSAPDATTAILQLRTKLELTKEDFEIVAVTVGVTQFAHFDVRQAQLAPYSARSP